jgi:TonB-linked SusC/RagA family outer membrane protein
MKQVKMKRLFMARGLLVALLAITSTIVFAQSRQITGSVVDTNGESVIGASVTIKGTTTGIITDVDGNFSLTVKPQDVLVISYLGYEAQSITIGNQTSLQVIMKDDTQLLDEVVVVGYGVVKKSDVTGSLAVLGKKEIEAMPVQNTMQAMQGKMAGVDITSNERPGEVGQIRIRGERSLNASNSPLFVVDGIPLQGVGFESINPNDIESINVLKDASATAIYGSRGANGVVLVTTKRGEKGGLKLMYSGTMTASKLQDRREMMDAGTWIEYARNAQRNYGNYPDVATIEADNTLFNKDPHAWANIEKGWAGGVWDGSKVPTYDWTGHGEQTAITQEHVLSASGGTDKIQSYTSFGYLNQEGTQPGQNFKRYTASSSIDLQATKWFKLGSTMNISYSDQEYGYSGGYYYALQASLPYAVPFTPEGEYIRNPGGDIGIVNPINENNLSKNRRQNLRALGSLYSEVTFGDLWNVLDGLRYRLQFGPGFQYHNNGQANPAESVTGDGLNNARYITSTRRTWTLDNLIYYDKTFGKHAFGLTLLQSASSSHVEDSDVSNTNVNSDKELWYNLGSTSDRTKWGIGTGMTESQMVSYMVRANYNFSEKYLLTISGRWDGASQLADNNKWDFFPSAAIGWRLDQESFLEDKDWISQLKLRLGVGVTGNAAIDAYATKGALASTDYSFGNQVQNGKVSSDFWVPNPVVMANIMLGWEKTATYNVGIDFSLIKGRVSGSIDVYKSKTSDLLMAQDIPALTGFKRTWANIGKTENKGIDLTLNTINIETHDFQWSSTITFSADKGKITELANNRTEDINNRWFVGEPLGVYYDYVYDGIWKTSEAEQALKYGRLPGQIRVKDLKNEPDKDGKITEKIDANEDREIVGKKRPDWSGGLSNTFTYKNFELSCFIYGRFGFSVEAGGERLGGRYPIRVIDYWIKDVNEDAEYYAPGTEDTYFTSMGYRDGSFIKIRNISLGYNFKSKLLKSAGISRLKLYSQVMNPVIIYSGVDWLDPDTGASSYNKSFVFGINLEF